ncbi:MAG: DUF2892 domain-containing protein [Nitrospira sp.]|nr:DUF2892 domain-containing protein [Candidatus Manganitrophaceae bacterium]HIL33824.1 DUF2892 domain-containing protein [Candidatus Manganitrophaceae bacterium]
MKCNVGKVDRTMRIILGIAIVAAGIHFESLWGAVGAIPLLTGSIGWCPIYSPFGLSTCSRK